MNAGASRNFAVVGGGGRRRRRRRRTVVMRWFDEGITAVRGGGNVERQNFILLLWENEERRVNVEVK